MSDLPDLKHPKQPAAARLSGSTTGSYVLGYVLSVVLTLTAYLLISHHVFSKNILILSVAWLALLQFLVQLLFFLHLDTETKPRFKLLAFGFMVVVVLILVVGSIWIMSSLNYRQTPDQINQYLKSQDGGI